MDFANRRMNAAYLEDLHARPPADKPPIDLKDSFNCLGHRSMHRVSHESRRYGGFAGVGWLLWS